MKRKTSIVLAVAGLTLAGLAAVLVQRRNEPGREAEPSVNHEHTGADNYTNRLIHSKSPYLLQHAHNPVDWYPWGNEAFEKARKESKPIFLSVGYSTCHWCHVMETRDMTGDQGQFYSAEDADSPLPGNPAAHAEGAFYVWEAGEITEALGKELAEMFSYYYGVEKRGNVDHDPRDEFPSKNVLIVSHTGDETVKKFGKSPEEIRKSLADARQKLFAVRAKRPRPHLDDKTITAWNGLMISAFARAYQVLDDPQYLSAATKSAQFIKTKLYDAKTGRLIRRYRAGEAAIDGFADDYAFLIQGLLDLYEVSFNINDLAWALDLQKKQNELFWDSSGSGFFSTTGNDPSVLLRMKEDYDGAEPSANSVATMNLLRLAEMLGRKEFRGLAEKTLAAFGSPLAQAPSAMPQMMVAFEFQLCRPKQIVISGKPEAEDTRAMLAAVHQEFMPNKIVLLADGAQGQAFLGKHLEFIQTVKPIPGKATAYVCENYVCQLPATDISTLKSQLKKAPMEPSSKRE